MKKLLTILFFAISLSLAGQNVYYVAPSGGSDSNPGTIASPWATWQKAFETAEAGDTVYFRGGSWYPTTPYSSQVLVKYAPSLGIGHNGTYDNHIVFTNYPGEVPILDCSNETITATNKYGFSFEGVTYVEFIGLTVQDLKQRVEHTYVNAIDGYNNGTLWLKQMKAINNGGAGIFIGGYDTLYLTNCDSFWNVDSLYTNIPGDAGNHADGYTIASGGTTADTTRVCYATGCRAFGNSDDGFDFGTTKQLYINNCWSIRNGYYVQGDGNGFKHSYSHLHTVTKRMQRNCITAYNYAYAFETANLVDAYYGPYMSFYNNTSWGDEQGFVTPPDGINCATAKQKEINRNNIVHNQRGSYKILYSSCEPSYYVTLDHNNYQVKEGFPYWEANPAINVTDADFLTTDSATIVNQLTASRQADGSLPNLTTAMKLASNSDLKGAGINVGMSATPDIGVDWAYLSEGDTPVTSITVSGTGGATSITTDNGTLQMLAAVLPEDATVKTVIWSVVNGSGTATINSSTGLLTALTDGSVLVVATATDGSGTSGSLSVSISNQVTSVPVSSITVSGAGGATTISTDNGTLQMSATVLPVDATISTVTWTRINGTGTASINSVSGMLTALTDGTVTVRATATDGSGVYDDQVITISNQVVDAATMLKSSSGVALKTRTGYFLKP